MNPGPCFILRRLPLFLVLGPLGCLAQNLLLNASFETISDAGGFLTDPQPPNPLATLDHWSVLVPTGLLRSGVVQFDGGGAPIPNSAPSDGSRYVFTNGFTFGQGLAQSFPVVAGATYEAAIHAQWFFVGDAGGRLELRVENLDQGSATVGSLVMAISPTAGQEQLGGSPVWTRYSFEFIAPQDATYRFLVRDVSVNPQNNFSLRFDEAEVLLVAIPEPASAAGLAGLAALGLLLGRRRRA